MSSLIVIVLLLAIAVSMVLVRIPRTEGRDDWRLPAWSATPVVLIAVVVAVFAFTTRIGTKEVGVVTSFGKISRCDLGPGLHFVWPWQKVVELDGTIQTDAFTGNSAIGVRIADGSTAEVSSTIRWRIDPGDACSLYQDYRSNDVDQNIADALVRTQFTAATASVFADFDPLLDIGATNANPVSTSTGSGIDLDQYSKDLAAALDDHLATASPTDKPEIQVVSVTVSYLTLASTTQDRLNQYQAEVAKTRIAAQAIQTARNNARANRTLAASVSHDPNVLVSKCLDIWERIVDNGGTPPPGTSCWPGSNATASVLVPSGSTAGAGQGSSGP